MELLSCCVCWNRRSLIIFLLSISFAAGTVLIPSSAHARKGVRQGSRPFRSALLIEAETGKVLKAHNERQKEIPASIVKMMTVLLTLERVKDKSISLSDMVVTSREASKIGGQQVYLAQGEQFPLEKLLQAIAISSANDAAYAVAEHVAGDVHTFIELMNERAQELGMTDTEFVNPHGLPPGWRKRPNRMSARDAGILAQELLKYPLVTQWGKMKHVPFRNGTFTLTNTNLLVGRYSGLDGLKTGSYRQAGYSIVATAKRGNLRLIAVILSSGHPKRRFVEAKRLLSWGFARYRWYETSAESVRETYSVKVEKGQKVAVPLKPKGNFRVLLRRGAAMKITKRTETPDSLQAPLSKGKKVGRIIYELRGEQIGEIDLITAEKIDEKLGFFRRLITWK